MSEADLNLLKSAVTAVSFLAFIGIVVWAYSRGARKGFDEAALLPFSDDDVPQASGTGTNHQG